MAKTAADYVKNPKGAYGTKSGLTPNRARTVSYEPNLATKQAATTGKRSADTRQPTEAFEVKHK